MEKQLCIYEIAEKDLISFIRSRLDQKTFPIKESDLKEEEKTKIISAARQIGADLPLFTSEVLNSKNFYMLVVEPSISRMSYYEPTFIKYIKALNIVKDIVKLPSNTKDSLYLKNGELFKGISDKDASKSLDMKVTLKDGRVGYLTHKFTKEAGGSQDNQLADVKKTLNHYIGSNKDKDKNFFLVANVDGAYYTNKILGKTSILEDLRNSYNIKGIRITTQYDFKDIIQTI